MKRDYANVMRVLMARYRGKAASEKGSAWECLLFTALSARSRDEQTETAFRAVMATYPDAKSLSRADEADVAALLRGIGLFRSKARQAIAMARGVTLRFGGVVPRTIAELTTLPGVGRKTASCVLVYAFGLPAIPVDTHVHRVANRLGWARTKSSTETEAALRASLPRRFWHDVNRVMVFFGREFCRPGVPHCWECPVAAWCAYPAKTPAPGRRKKGK